jgi:hypothetical protein
MEAPISCLEVYFSQRLPATIQQELTKFGAGSSGSQSRLRLDRTRMSQELVAPVRLGTEPRLVRCSAQSTEIPIVAWDVAAPASEEVTHRPRVKDIVDRGGRGER